MYTVTYYKQKSLGELEKGFIKYSSLETAKAFIERTKEENKVWCRERGYSRYVDVELSIRVDK